MVFVSRTGLTKADIDSNFARTIEERCVAAALLAQCGDMLKGGIGMVKDAVDKGAWADRNTAIALGSYLASAPLFGTGACPVQGFLPPQNDKISGRSKIVVTRMAFSATGCRDDGDRLVAPHKARFTKEQFIRHV
jgi:hypothetical protein